MSRSGGASRASSRLHPRFGTREQGFLQRRLRADFILNPQLHREKFDRLLVDQRIDVHHHALPHQGSPIPPRIRLRSPRRSCEPYRDLDGDFPLARRGGARTSLSLQHALPVSTSAVLLFAFRSRQSSGCLSGSATLLPVRSGTRHSGQRGIHGILAVYNLDPSFPRPLDRNPPRVRLGSRLARSCRLFLIRLRR
jgi:hypothetical protein